MHLPTTARSPTDDSDSNTTSVSWTVSIVSTVVVPESRSSDAASSADARSVDGVCAASIGQIRRFSHSSSGMSSADPRKSVWHRWTWVWMKPGRRYPPRASMTCSYRPSGSGPIETMRPSRTTTAPSTMSSRSFIVTIVALRISVDDIDVGLGTRDSGFGIRIRDLGIRDPVAPSSRDVPCRRPFGRR